MATEDPKKPRIRPYDEKGDYTLWGIRIEAACEVKGLKDILKAERPPAAATPPDQEEFSNSQKCASHLTVNAMTGKPLRVVRGDIENPYRMLSKLDERYDSKSAASRICKMSELVSLRYSSIKQDLRSHIDKISALIEQLRGMKNTVEDDLAVAILITTVDSPHLLPTRAAIKTLSNDKLNWNDVTARLLEELQTLKLKSSHTERAFAATTPRSRKCEICEKKSLTTAKCWLNLRNPKNRLNLQQKVSQRDESTPKPASPPAQPDSNNLNKEPEKAKKPKLVAGAKVNVTQPKTFDTIMLDFGTTSHITRQVNHLENAETRTVSISLGDDSTIKATHTGSRRAEWHSPYGKTNLTLSNILASPKNSMSLLSIPALASK